MGNKLWLIVGIMLLFSLIGLSTANADMGLMSSSPPNVWLSDGTTSIKATVFPSQYAGYDFAIYQGTTLIQGITTSSSEYEFTGLIPSTSYIIKVSGITNGVYSPQFVTNYGTFAPATSAYCRTTASIPTISTGVVNYQVGGCNIYEYKTLKVTNENLGQEMSTTSYVFPVNFQVYSPYKTYLTKITRSDVFGNIFSSYATATAGGCDSPTFDYTVSQTSNTVYWNLDSSKYTYGYTYEIRLGGTLITSGTTAWDYGSYSGLVPSTTYTLKIIGQSYCGDGYSLVKTFTTNAPSPNPSTDFSVNVQNITTTSANITISPNVATGYDIGIYSSDQLTLITGSSVTVPYWDATGLVVNKLYWAKVTSYQVNGTLIKWKQFTTSQTGYVGLFMNTTTVTSVFSACIKINWYYANGTESDYPAGWYSTDFNITENATSIYNLTRTVIPSPFYTCLATEASRTLLLEPNKSYNANVTTKTFNYGNLNYVDTFTTLPFNGSDYTITAHVTDISASDYNMQKRFDVDYEVYVSLATTDLANYYSYVLKDSNGNFLESGTVNNTNVILTNLTVNKKYVLELSPTIYTRGTPYALDTRIINITPVIISRIVCNDGTFSNDFTYTPVIDGSRLSIRINPDYLPSEYKYMTGFVNATIRNTNQNLVGRDYKDGNDPTIVFDGLDVNRNYTVELLRTIVCNNAVPVQTNPLCGGIFRSFIKDCDVSIVTLPSQMNTIKKTFNIQLSAFGYGILTTPMSWADIILPSQMAKFAVAMIISAIIGVALMYFTKTAFTGIVPVILGFLVCAGLGWVPMVVWGVLGLIATIGAIYLVYAKLAGG